MNEPTPDHEELRTWAASYVLGALDPGERSLYARHLQTCDDCRAEVASLAPIPGLLSGLASTPAITAPTSAPTALDTAPRTVLDGALQRARATRRRERRALHAWRAAAVAAALVALATIASRPSAGSEQAEPSIDAALDTATTVRTATTAATPIGTGAPVTTPVTVPAPGAATTPSGATTTTVAPDAVTLTLRPAAEGSSESGTVRLESRRWGTAVFLEASGLPTREVYTLWAVSEDGRREPAASWGPTPSGRTTCAGATSISPDELARIEIGDEAGVLATATNA